MNINSRQLTILGLLALIVILAGLSLFSWFSSVGGMMPGMMHSPQIRGLGFLWQLLLCLTPLVLITLLGGGLAWWVTSIGGWPRPVEKTDDCPNCGRPVEADWEVCPYCGVSLEEKGSTVVENERD